MKHLSLRSTGFIIVIGLVLSSCSIPGSGSVRSIAPDKIPYDLNATTTRPPNTTVPATSTMPPVVETTTSTIASTIPVEIVQLFFVAGTQVVPAFSSAPQSHRRFLQLSPKAHPKGTLPLVYVAPCRSVSSLKSPSNVEWPQFSYHQHSSLIYLVASSVLPSPKSF